VLVLTSAAAETTARDTVSASPLVDGRSGPDGPPGPDFPNGPDRRPRMNATTVRLGTRRRFPVLSCTKSFGLCQGSVGVGRGQCSYLSEVAPAPMSPDAVPRSSATFAGNRRGNRQLETCPATHISTRTRPSSRHLARVRAPCARPSGTPASGARCCPVAAELKIEFRMARDLQVAVALHHLEGAQHLAWRFPDAIAARAGRSRAWSRSALGRRIAQRSGRPRR
jgi:hypothetical protein